MVSVLQSRVAALVGVLGLIGLVIDDAIGDGFWNRHALITSLVANLVVIALTVGVVNEVADRRARARWAGLAQYVMVELVRSARGAWMFLGDLGGLVLEPDDRSPGERLAASREIARDTAEVRRALAEVLADPPRRAVLAEALNHIGRLSGDVIARWAGVMIASPGYAAMFDRHVELQTRVNWLATLFTHYEGTDLSPARRRVVSSSIAVEITEHVDDDTLLAMLVSIVGLALRLDEETTALGLTLVPAAEWMARTADLMGTPFPS